MYSKFFETDPDIIDDDAKDIYASAWLDKVITNLKDCSTDFLENRLKQTYPRDATLDTLAQEFISERYLKTRALRIVTGPEEPLPNFEQRWGKTIEYVFDCCVQACYDHPVESKEALIFLCEFLEFSTKAFDELTKLFGKNSEHFIDDFDVNAYLATTHLIISTAYMEYNDTINVFEHAELMLKYVDRANEIEHNNDKVIDEIQGEFHHNLGLYYFKLSEKAKHENAKQELFTKAETNLKLAKIYDPTIDIETKT